VVGAFDTPRMEYSLDHKQFVPAKGKRAVLHSSSADPRPAFHRERFHVLRQRTLRNDLFAQRVEGVESNESFEITPLSALLGHAKAPRSRRGADHGIIVMGLVAQLEEGRYYLEDLDGRVRLSLQDVECSVGLFTENTIVIAEGKYEDEVFTAWSLAFPPPEPRIESIKTFGALNYFGGVTNATEQPVLTQLEYDQDDAMFVVVSDVWLDKPQVLERLRRMFEGYSTLEQPPIFVLMGNFLSQPYGAESAAVLKGGMDTLCDIICEFPELSESANFIFVPGPKDLGAPNILPRRPLPRLCTERLAARVKQSTFTTNPARVRYCTQELVFFREDIVNKMRRNCILSPKTKDLEITAHLVKTLVDQAHLVPLPLHVSPVYWEFDHALRLYPVPDVLVLADKFDSYTHTYESTTAINPGSFVTSDYSFMVYWPSKLRIDPDESEESKAEFESRTEFSRIG